MKPREVAPQARLALVLGVVGALLGIGAIAPNFVVVAVLLSALSLAVALFDLRTAVPFGQLRVSRQVASVLSHGTANRVIVTATNHSSHPATLELEEVWPTTVTPDRVRLRLRVPPGQEASVTYHVTPHKRGPITVAAAAARSHGPLRLISRQHDAVIGGEGVRVYPAIEGVARYELAARRSLVAQIGIRSVRALGSGTEIEGLREYAADDDFRRIDWKATARRGIPMTRNLRDERNQTVILLLDAGRLGTIEMGGGMTRLDHAINASLVFAHVAGVHGDRVGLMLFDRQVRRYVAPGSASRALVPRLARVLYDAAPEPVESDYRLAFDHLAQRHRKRALVVLFSDLLSAEGSEALIDHMGRSSRRHLTLCVALADPALRDAAQAPISDAASVYALAAAREIRDERDQALEAMRRRGVMVLDVRPTDAVPVMVSHYLALKARRVL